MLQSKSKAVSLPSLPADGAAEDASARLLAHVLRFLSYVALSFLIVLSVELLSRCEYVDLPDFFLSTARPGWTTVGVVMLFMLTVDALLGRRYISLLAAVPIALIPAFVSGQKRLYLSDPLYPTDLAFGRQILELLPAMVKDLSLIHI